MRVKAVISYDGSAFYGFQKQTSTPQTVTGSIEKALKQLQIDTTIVGSGRTDRGVHATGQVIHFDLPEFWTDTEKLKNILNRRLEAIYFQSLTTVPETFHARFDAQKRLYRYLFKTTKPSVFERNYIAYYPRQFNIKKLNHALGCFIGEHDFRYFYKTGSEVHTTVRKVFKADCYEKKGYFVIRFEANGFLRSQVRMMVNTAILYAQGDIDYATLEAQIDGHRQSVTSLAPPEGLYLARISYPLPLQVSV